MNDLLFAIIAFLCLVTVTLVLLHTIKRANAFLVIVISAVAVNFLSVVVIYSVDMKVSYWIFSPPYFLLVIVLIFCLGAVYSSASLQMLGALLRRGGRISLLTLYDEVVRKSFDMRIAEHVDRKMAERIEDKFYLTSYGHSLVTNVERIKAIFAIRQTGIY